MKKIALFFGIIIAIISTMTYIYLNNVVKLKNAEKENLKFEVYKDKEISGSDLASIINKAIDNNQKNEINKEKNGKYIDNDVNSINIDIKFIDDDIIYNIEKIYNGGIEKFVYYYRNIVFVCKEVQYHTSTGKIKYMMFEQITQ